MEVKQRNNWETICQWLTFALANKLAWFFLIIGQVNGAKRRRCAGEMAVPFWLLPHMYGSWQLVSIFHFPLFCQIDEILQSQEKEILLFENQPARARAIQAKYSLSSYLFIQANNSSANHITTIVYRLKLSLINCWLWFFFQNNQTSTMQYLRYILKWLSYLPLFIF